jgi:hypothetical protein
MLQKILEIGSRIAAPMGLAGFSAAALFGIAWLILKKVPRLNRDGSTTVVLRILTLLFWLAVITAVLALIGYIAGIDQKRGTAATPQVQQAVRQLTNQISSLPQIALETLDGLPVEITNAAALRLNRLIVRNTSESEIENLCSHLQLPEPNC